MIEVGCGGHPGTAHCDPEILLHDDEALKKFRNTVEKHHMEISALSVHCNTIHPNKEIAAKADYDTHRAVLKIREAVGPEIGANLDPSHLIWQGIEPVAAIRKLGDAIYHVHAKDTKLDKYNIAADGVLDTKHYSDEIHRSWVFRSVGYGNGEQYWRDLISALRLVGYDRVLSIEHEDSLMSIDEGLKKAVEFLRPSVINEPKPTTMGWA